MNNDITHLQNRRKNLDYWKNKKHNNIHPANLGLDFQRPDEYTDEILELKFNFEPALTQQIIGLANGEPFLIYSILMSALNICLYKYRGDSSLLVGSPLLKKEDIAAGHNGGVMVINEIRPTDSFKEVLIACKKNLLEGYKKCDYAYDDLLKQLDLAHITNKCPVFDISLALNNIHREMPPLKNDIRISFNLETGDLPAVIAYNKNLFYPETIQQFTLHYARVLETALQTPEILVSQLSLVSPREERQLRAILDNTHGDSFSHKRIDRLFEETVEKTPKKTALVCGSDTLTFKDLNEQSNQVAHYLQDLGMKPNSLVGIYLERSLHMIVALLGTLKAGGVVLPLDPMDGSNTKKSLAEITKQRDVRFFLTTVLLVNNLPRGTGEIICLDYDKEKISMQATENPGLTVSADDAAYALLTGDPHQETGTVLIPHNVWANVLHGLSKEFDLISPLSADKNLLVTSFGSHMALNSIGLSLVNGCPLHLLNSNYPDAGLISETVKEEGITLIHCTPHIFYPLIEEKGEEYLFLKSLRLVILGGETLSASVLKHWAQSENCNAQIVNVYGTRQCGGISSFYPLTNFERYLQASIPIGKPISNTRILIMDKNGELTAKGLAGEICITGAGSGGGETIHRTGDLGRILPGGNLEYIGGIHGQIKLRGTTVEPGEIEAAIRRMDIIEDAVVLQQIPAQNQPHPTAYISVKKDVETLTDDVVTGRVKRYLEPKMPDYMVPEAYFLLKQMPLNAAGKIDRKALADMDTSASGTSREENGDLCEVEQLLLNIFAETLNVEDVGIDDNFFEIGGHSLLAAGVVTSITESLNVELVVVDLLANPTVKRFAARIKEEIAG